MVSVDGSEVEDPAVVVMDSVNLMDVIHWVLLERLEGAAIGVQVT